MRRFILFFFFLLSQTAFAASYFPVYVNSSTYYGTGVISIKGNVEIYSLENNPQIIGTINQNGINNLAPENVFLVSKENGIRLLPVKSDDDEWYIVCYNQTKKLFGRIKKAENIDYMNYPQLFNLYGRKNGIYIFRNLPDKYKKLYSSPNEESTLVDSFTFPKHIALWLISGDWVLVKVTTYDAQTKTGWLRYRSENGTLFAFPDFTQEN
ncbi:MAG: hypothetical protein LUE64_07380 [Candidatus Gastranaerophilales bacterium]|nr:hypothetical protein [Candidatus Gastranaerophilales bacterium]